LALSLVLYMLTISWDISFPISVSESNVVFRYLPFSFIY
jgi:hypothetical protein